MHSNMDTTKVENSSLNWKAVIDELTKGRDFATQLGAILEAAEATAATSAKRELVDSISSSFSRALVALESVVKPESLNCQDGFSQRKRKIQCRQRGGHRRRSNKLCVKKIVATTKDGHSWRKYGQKEIFNSKFPRSYFRCTYKHDQNCLATRQVQQSEEDPSLFAITYLGEHTCRGPCILDFASGATTTHFLGAKKIGLEEDVVSNTLASGVTQMDVALDESESARFVAELMGGASDFGDVTSSLHRDDDMGWGFILQSFQLRE